MLCAECKGKIDKPIHRRSMENAPGVWIKLTLNQIASTIHSMSFLITGCRRCSSDSEAANMTKEECVKETRRWLALMGRLLKQEAKLKSKEFAAISCLKKREGTRKEFGLDGLSLENAFVDEQDPTNITCTIDWESTTKRPLWQAAHLPAFLQSSSLFTAKLFREV
ncbi:hypothetical protein PQX77_020803 [Marasmius sp. AFHP31]|nr:hypothetical protein PQX77_020803 [Marasmius sp. AFHP31]